MHKLENPIRLKELDPETTLKNIGLNKDSVFCDIGAGTGIFTIPAAQITAAHVYALDMSADMLKIITDKSDVLGLDHIHTIKADTPPYPIQDNTCDIVLMCTVLHEIDDKAALMQEIRRILKPDGRFAVIEFFKKETPMGPPVSRRISAADVADIAHKNGFKTVSQTALGDNFYLAVFSPLL